MMKLWHNLDAHASQGSHTADNLDNLEIVCEGACVNEDTAKCEDKVDAEEAVLCEVAVREGEGDVDPDAIVDASS